MFPRLITFVTTSSGSLLCCNIEFLMDFYAVVWVRRESIRTVVRPMVGARQALHVFRGL